MEAEAAESAQKQDEQDQREQSEAAFHSAIETSLDLADNLQHLCDFVKEKSNATGCYIG